MDISVIVTVFNKEKYIKDTIESILALNDEYSKEIIIADDNSTDNSCKIIQKYASKYPQIKLIKNKINKGPAVRLNQAASYANGKYFLFLDGDDLLPNNICKIVIPILQKQQADFLYGKRLNMQNPEDKNYLLNANPQFELFTNPLLSILSGKFVRINLITTKEIFIKSGGCEEKIFIQDESLPLRLALVAKKFVYINDNIVLTPFANNHSNESDKLSANSLQENHDRFFAYFYSKDLIIDFDKNTRQIFYQRMVSSFWKSIRLSNKKLIKIQVFIFYLIIKIFKLIPSSKQISKMQNFLTNQPNIRRNI